MKKLLMSIPIVILLSSCASGIDVTTSPIKRSNLNIPIMEPLNMDNVQWKVIVENDKPSYCVNNQNFVNLANNMEKVQNRLKLQYEVIKKQKEYYETTLNQ